MSDKTPRIVVGTLGGGFISALCFASLSWIVIYNSDPGYGAKGPFPQWAYIAAVLSGFKGVVLGLPIGFVIGLVNRGAILGTFLGLLAGVAAIVWGALTAAHPDIIYPTIPVLISFLPAGASSGLLTSLVVSRSFSTNQPDAVANPL